MKLIRALALAPAASAMGIFDPSVNVPESNGLTTLPTGVPSQAPTGEPSGVPSRAPSGESSRAPTGEPSRAPTGEPSRAPTAEPQGIIFTSNTELVANPVTYCSDARRP